MQITLTLNGVRVSEEIAPDMLLIDFVRAHGCKSVKRGCETSNCGLCTVFMDDKPVLSCSVLAARADGHKITTLEGLQQEAAEFGAFIADQGAEQCGFCNPGFIMNALALFREQPYPTEEQVKEYLAENLNRITGEYSKSLYDDLSKYCTMYDYRSRDGETDWGNSRDAVERTVAFLNGRIYKEE